MALDGAFLRHIKKEIEISSLNSRVDKINQPNRDEIIIYLRNKSSTNKLLISTRATSPRIHFTNDNIENPKTPPMLCMLLRKKLIGSHLISIRQKDLERVLFLDFDCVNELYEKVKLTLAVEIMGKYSNLILIDNEYKIIDALKRVDPAMSSKRLILPGIKYELPPSQDKKCLLKCDINEIIKSIKNTDKPISKYMIENLQGLSPIVCKQIEYNKQDLNKSIIDLYNTINDITGSAYMILDNNLKPIDFSFIDINCYENLAFTKKFNSFSELLDSFFMERDRTNRMAAKSHHLNKMLVNISSKLTKKIAKQKIELSACKDRYKLKMYADLLNANLYNIKDSTQYVELENFYDDKLPIIKIKLDPLLTASQNAQKYYKEYRKLKTSETFLTDQIEKAQKELNYIDSVIEELNRVSSEAEITEIKQELTEQGYIKESKNTAKRLKPLDPLQFISSEGFKILVGRNNLQNDKLTLHKAKKDDIWFHVKDAPGSHTVILSENKIPDDKTISQAAMIAAFYSKARNSSNVAVDYTKIRNVHKPNGAKPGMVIYVNYNTLFVTPDKDIVDNLRYK